MALLRVRVDGVEHLIDPEAFTIREAHERRKSLEDAGLPSSDPMLLAASTVFVALRRTDETVTLDAVLDSMTVGDYRSMEPVKEEGSDPSH